MKKPALILAAVTVAVGGGAAIALLGQGQLSPPAETSTAINGKKITIKYHAPSVRNRQIFGAGGRVSKDGTYPVWRAGANEATALHTDAALDINGLQVPPGDYTMWVQVDPEPWQLVINKQIGQWGTEYNKAQDLGRVKMTMSKPPALIETYVMSLTNAGGNKGKLQLEWEHKAASVTFTVK